MVDLFFVLSGFVMVHSYKEKLTAFKDVKPFLVSRFWRLYPLHFVMLLVFSGFEIMKYIAQEKYGIYANTPAFTYSDLQSFGYHLLLLHSMGFQEHGTFNTPSWSISTEFYTYVLFSFLATLSIGDRGKKLIYMFVCFVSLTVVLAAGKSSLTFDDELSFFRCTYGFFLGAMGYYVYEELKAASELTPNWRRLVNRVLLLCVIPFYFLVCIKNDNFLEFFMTPLALIFIITLCLHTNSIVNRVLCVSPLQWLGKISYSIYMIHMAVIWVISSFLQVFFDLGVVKSGNESLIATPPVTGLVLVIFTLIVTLVVAHFSNKYIELRYRKGLKRENC